MKRLILCITLLSLSFAGINSANAARHRKIFKTETTISAVSSTSISLKSGSATHIYKISSHTVIHVDGVKAEAKDLQKGMRAEVTTSQLEPGTASAVEASRP